MNTLLMVLLLTTLAGLAIPAGAFLARFERIQPRWLETEFRHAVIAFGGGVLVSAVGLVLVPEGLHMLPDGSAQWLGMALFLAGGVVFMVLDYALDRWGTSSSQLVAMLADFVPEALALGGMAAGGGGAMLLAMMIALQNVPEGFNAYRELRAQGQHASHDEPTGKQPLSSRRLLTVMAMLALLGPAAGTVGHLWLSGYPWAVGSVMLFAAGGILYLTFQDIAPQAVLQRKWAPTLAAVLGFALGLSGQVLTGG